MRSTPVDATDALPTGGSGPIAEPVTRRTGAAAMALTGVSFLLYPVIRPWGDETTLAGARGMASTAWIAAHLFAIAGFILLALGLQALYGVLRPTRAGQLAGRALVVTWLGAGLTLPYYGVEVFGAHVIAQRAVATHDAGVLDMVNEFRFNPAATVLFAAGLLLLAVGMILAAVAIWRSGRLPRWSGVPAAVGFALFIPQFFAGAEIRIAHGALIAAGCAWLAATLWRDN
jgi:hypothetical protein